MKSVQKHAQCTVMLAATVVVAMIFSLRTLYESSLVQEGQRKPPDSSRCPLQSTWEGVHKVLSNQKQY